MSDRTDDDDDLTDDQRDRRHRARKMIVEACAEYADAFEWTEGALVSGYVCAFELSDLSDNRWMIWFTGDGNEPRGDALGGLASWRVEGMLRRVIRDINVKDVSTY